MKFSFKFSNILGAVYRKGNLLFSPDGNSVISPVGNRICIYNLKNNTSSTLPVESRFNYECLALSPSGNVLIAVNEDGEAHLITMVTRRKIFTYRFNEKVRCIRFSPDGKYFAVCKLNKVFLYRAPENDSTEYSGQFILERVYSDFADNTTFIDWSGDSRVIAVGAKDGVTKIFSVPYLEKFRRCTLAGHADSIIAAFFEKDSMHINTISRNGVLCIWECNKRLSDLKTCQIKYVRQDKLDDEDDIDLTTGEERDIILLKENIEPEIKDDSEERMRYHLCPPKRYLNDHFKNEKRSYVTTCEYHKHSRILVTGFSNGAFLILELPEVNLLHSLSISESSVSTIAINNLGDWITFGCEGQGQLLVWEWQSETYILKQQAHSSSMSCLDYSADGLYIATGGEDGKVKLWNTQTGFCFVTFNEHTSVVSAVKFGNNRKFLLSASADGTVRAFDMARYRNYRTFASPRPVQFSCIAIDSANEFVAAGAQDVFEIYLWSMKIGHLLECLSGHEGPVVSIAFSPVGSSSSFASTSWDKTLRIWNSLETTQEHDTIQLIAEGLCVAYRPDGKEIAVASLDGQISFFDPSKGEQTRSIEGRQDLGSGRSETDVITAKKSEQAKAFTSLCYSSDGNYIIAAGQSKNVCIYHVAEGILVKKFEITQNRSLDAVDDIINRRKMTEFGNMDLIEKREENEGGNVKIKLPGVVKGDMAARSFKPEVRVYDISFSPTGLAWSAATTEGVLIYSLDANDVFDPFHLDIDVTPESIKNTLGDKDYSKALIMCLKLNEKEIVQQVVESIPPDDIELCIKSLPKVFIDRLLKFVAVFVDSSPLIEYYLLWTEHLLNANNSSSTCHPSILLTLHRNLKKKLDDLTKVCDFNKYTMQFIQKVASRKKATSDPKTHSEVMDLADSDDDDESAVEDSYLELKTEEQSELMMVDV